MLRSLNQLQQDPLLKDASLGYLIVDVTARDPVIVADYNAKQLMIQLIAVVAAGAYACIVTLIIAFVLDKTIGLRVDKEDEIIGLDQTQHSESGYNM